NFAFTIGVSGNHHFISLTEKAADHIKLLPDIILHHHLPLFRKDRQNVNFPGTAKLLTIRLRWRLLQQVTKGPGHNKVLTFNRTVNTSGSPKYSGYITGL